MDYHQHTTAPSGPPPAYSSSHRSSSVEPYRLQHQHQQTTTKSNVALRKSPDTNKAVLAVSPFGLAETIDQQEHNRKIGGNGAGGVLKQLCKEAGHLMGQKPVQAGHQSATRLSKFTTSHQQQQHGKLDENRLQSMIDNYQLHVRQQNKQMQLDQPPIGCHQPHSASSGIDGAISIVQRNSQPGPMSLSQPNLNNCIQGNSHQRQIAAQLITVNNSDPAPSIANEKKSFLSPAIDSDSSVMVPLQSSSGAAGCWEMVPSVLYQAVQQNQHQKSQVSTTLNNQLEDLECPQTRVTTRIMSLLSEENKSLRQQLESYVKKTIKLQQLELAYQRIQREYEDLVRHKEKQEALEKQAATKMDIEIRRLQQENSLFQERIYNLSTEINQIHEMGSDGADAQEIDRLNSILTQLIPQNKDLLACKERQSVELHAQTATLEEQRAHIQILEKALRNAQEKALRKENECQQLKGMAERNAELQQALQEAIADKQMREETHKRQTAQWEMETTQLRMQLAKEDSNDAGSRKGLGLNFDQSMARIQLDLDVKDEKIISLEKKLLDLGAKYDTELERRTREQEDEARGFFDRIKELEDRNNERDEMVTDLTCENQQLRKDTIQAKCLVSSLETKVKQMDAALAEKDSMIDILKQDLKKPADGTNIVSVGDYKQRLAPTRLNINGSSSMERSGFGSEKVRWEMLQQDKRPCWSRHAKYPVPLDSHYGYSSSLDRRHRIITSKGRSESSEPGYSRFSVEQRKRERMNGDSHTRRSSGADPVQHFLDRRRLVNLTALDATKTTLFGGPVDKMNVSSSNTSAADCKFSPNGNSKRDAKNEQNELSADSKLGATSNNDGNVWNV